MGFTTTQITTLEAAIASGVLEVRYADRTVKYQDLKAMRDALAQMRAEVAAENGRERFTRVASSKGLD